MWGWDNRPHDEFSSDGVLTCVLGKPLADADLQGFAGGLQHRRVSLTLNEEHLAGAASAQEAPVLLLQLHLQSEGHSRTSSGHSYLLFLIYSQ